MIKLNFETLTPLHISNGNQLAYNLDYITTNDTDGNVYVAKLNMFNASSQLATSKVFNFFKDYRFSDVIRIIEENKDIFNESSFDYKVYAVDTFIEYLKGERRVGRKIIQEFVNVNGNFYIPGSSIKGALTTILNRNPDKNPLGINPKNPDIADKFVITDSSFISSDNFVVDIANRPPSINLITMDPGVDFSVSIKSKGNLQLDSLRDKLKNYATKQLEKAKEYTKKFKKFERKPGGATQYFNLVEKMINEIHLNDDTYLLNLGFGGGSYFKIYDNVQIPTFPSKRRRNLREEAHTTFAVNIENEFYQLGWCKLKIEEK